MSPAHISSIATGRPMAWETITRLSQLHAIPQHAPAGRALDIQSEVQEAIEVAAELNAAHRALLLAMNQFLQARRPPAHAGAAWA